VRFQDTCSSCPAAGFGIAAAIAFVIGYVAVLQYMVVTGDSNTAADEERSVIQRIAVTYMVTLSSIGDFKARGPQFLRDAVGWARPVSGGLNFGFYPIRCSLGLGYFYETWGTALLPLLLVFSFSAVELVRVKVMREGRVQSKSLWTCIVLVLYLMYPSVVETLLAGLHNFCFRCSSAD
jgi:hypothetical protein